MLVTVGIYMPGGWEWIIILVIALLIFGKRLPDVGKSLGKGIVEFKKGLKGVKDEMDGINEDVQDAVDRPDEAPKPEPPKLSAAEAEQPFDAPKQPEHEEAKGKSEGRSPQPGT